MCVLWLAAIVSQGPSGSGKTTLLNVLGGRAMAGVTGELHMNGVPITKRMKRIVAYVLQEDIFLVHLTVREQLTFTAQLRLPETIPKEERLAQVDHVMKRLNITKCADTPIMLVSGGEKKRVNIGTELLTNPSVILLDEPTSGLDSTTAAALVATLRDLAAAGKTVITSIHQPSSNVFYSFDRLFVLADGHMVYSGTPDNCLPYLESLGFVLTLDYNPAEFLMDLVTGYDLHGEKLQETPPRQTMIEAFDAEANLREVEAVEATMAKDTGVLDPARPTSYWTQLKVLTQRCSKDAGAQLFTALNLIQGVGFAVVCGLCWFQMDNDESGVRDRSSFVYFLTTYFMMNTCMPAMLAFPQERQILLKERASGSYQLSAYFLAKSISESPVRLVPPLIYIIITYWMAGLNPTAESFFGFAGTMLLGTLVGEAIGVLLGIVMMDVRNGMIFNTVVMHLLMIVGGFFVENVQSWLDWAKYISVFKYAYHAALWFEFAPGREFDCANGQIVAKCSNAGVIRVDGEDILDALDVQGSIGFNIGMLVLFLVVARVAGYLCLRFLKHNQGRQ